jgi:hypothetical protein
MTLMSEDKMKTPTKSTLMIAAAAFMCPSNVGSASYSMHRRHDLETGLGGGV